MHKVWYIRKVMKNRNFSPNGRPTPPSQDISRNVFSKTLWLGEATQSVKPGNCALNKHTPVTHWIVLIINFHFWITTQTLALMFIINLHFHRNALHAQNAWLLKNVPDHVKVINSGKLLKSQSSLHSKSYWNVKPKFEIDFWVSRMACLKTSGYADKFKRFIVWESH